MKREPLTRQQLIVVLAAKGACTDSLAWVIDQWRDARSIWLACENPRWLTWVLAELQPIKDCPQHTWDDAMSGRYSRCKVCEMYRRMSESGKQFDDSDERRRARCEIIRQYIPWEKVEKSIRKWLKEHNLL